MATAEGNPMTVVFRVPLRHGDWKDPYEVSISRDGEMSILNYDQEQYDYDRAMAEFGEASTPPMIVTRYWNSSHSGKIRTIQGWLSISGLKQRHLAVDWAEHVIDVYEDVFPGDRRLRSAIELVHESMERTQYYVSESEKEKNKEILDRAQEICKEVLFNIEKSFGMYKDISGKANHAAMAVKCATIGVINILFLVTCALEARAYQAAKEIFAPAWDIAWQAEANWQIRRFHDVAEAWLSKRPWPPLEATQ